MNARWQPDALPGLQPALAAPAPRGPDGQPVADPGLDPYLRWALHTGWRGFAHLARWKGRPPEEQRLQIIARADTLDLLRAAVQCSWLSVSDVYAQDIPGGTRPALHFSATIALPDLPHLLQNPQRLRWKLALPLRDAESASRASPKGLFGPERDQETMEAGNLVAAAIKPLHPLPAPPKLAAALAVIDAGCPFLNQAFREGQGTRVAALWDQGSDPPDAWPKKKIRRLGEGWPWRALDSFNYGREMGRQALDAISAAVVQSSPALDETEVYRGIDFMIDHGDARRRAWFATHGGHVLSVAGGKPDPLPRELHAASDPAADADLVFVQLPMAVAMDSGGGSLAPHLLDGVRYAMSLMREPDSPLVVNISYGGQAGPHDGTSLIESALSELMQERSRNFAIVLAAGNSRQAACHARREVGIDRSVMLRVALPPEDRTDSFIELWYAEPPAGLEVRCRVRTPEQDWSPWVAPGREVLLRETRVGREVVALVRHDGRVPNGARAMILVALGPTAPAPEVPGALSQPGEWAIELKLERTSRAKLTVDRVTIDAWIERDDPAPSSSRPIATFVDQEPADELDTCSSIANGALTIAVGGFNLGTSEPAPYSACGPADSDTPAVLAVCEEDEVTPSIAAAATRSHESYRLNGTSVAAPVLARRLFNHLSAETVPGSRMRACVRRLATSGDPALKRPE